MTNESFFADYLAASLRLAVPLAFAALGWHPIGTALACLLFGATEALQLRIQALGVNIPYQFLVMLPYAIALFALVGLAGKSSPPAALGLPYLKEEGETR